MALPTTQFGYRGDIEERFDFPPIRRCDHYYRSGNLKDVPSSFSWYMLPGFTRGSPFASLGQESSNILVESLVGDLRPVLDALRVLRGSQILSHNSGLPQVAELRDIIRQLLSEVADDSVTRADADRDSQSEATYGLIDWESINEGQLESGITASFGEDGEPLELFDGSFTMLQPLEDDDVEVLNE